MRQDNRITFWAVFVTGFALAPSLDAQRTPATRDAPLPTASATEEDAPHAVRPAPEPAPIRVAQDRERHPVDKQAKPGLLDKAAHLRLAARHLLAAGRSKLAKQIQRDAVAEEEHTRIHELQSEFDRLRTATATPDTVTIHLKIMELQVTKMRKLGLDFQTAGGNGPQPIKGATIATWSVVNGFITALQKHGLIKVLAEPTLITVSGRPASVKIGGAFPVIVPDRSETLAVEYRQFGTQLDCVAKVLDDRIRIELAATVSEIDDARSVVVNGRSIPGLRVRKIDTAVELKAGQTCLIRSMARRQHEHSGDTSDTEEIALLVMLTVDVDKSRED